jgi:hypothetical protein
MVKTGKIISTRRLWQPDAALPSKLNRQQRTCYVFESEIKWSLGITGKKHNIPLYALSGFGWQVQILEGLTQDLNIQKSYSFDENLF